MADFKTFNDPVLKTMLERADEFNDHMQNGDKPRWISFLGKPGTGKTHLGTKLFQFWNYTDACERVENMDRFGKMVCWRSIANRLRDGQFGLFEDLKREMFLFVDDLGTNRQTEFLNEKMEELVSSRMGKWTVFTSNLSPDQFKTIDARIFSRFIRGENIMVECDTVDYGLREK